MGWGGAGRGVLYVRSMGAVVIPTSGIIQVTSRLCLAGRKRGGTHDWSGMACATTVKGVNGFVLSLWVQV